MKNILIFLLLVTLSSKAQTTYYVATNGNAGNSGLTTNSPWTLTKALSSAGQSNIISLLPGNYPIIDLGTPSAHIGLTIKSYFKWQAKITGTAGDHCFATEAGVSNVVVDGLQIANSWIDGIKFNSHGCTARNNWVYGSGHGNPAWVTNTDSSFSGQGISAHNFYGTLIENNLIENGGAWTGHDHAIYINGTNCIIRNNVMRYNRAFGVQVYENEPQAAKDVQVYNNLIYGNGRGITVYSQTNCTNYIYGNTIVSATAAVESSPILVRDRGGVIKATNNICIGNGYSIASDESPVWYEDYNIISTAVAGGSGPHDILSSQASFVNTNTGLFWIKVTSNAKAAAKTTIYGPVNFFGASQSSVADIGAFQYNASYAGDTRTLDPSGSNGADYWIILGTPPIPGNILTTGTVRFGH